MLIDGRSFETQIVADLKRDGMWLEVWETTNGRYDNVAGIFYSDVSGRFTFSAFEEDLPLGLLEITGHIARTRLVPETKLAGEN
jgi:hypothetical protein